MRRLATGDRWFAAEIVVRALGLLCLALCALAASWLYRATQAASFQGTTLLEYALAACAFLSWGVGGAFVIEGPALFKLVPAPARHLIDFGELNV